MNNFNNLVDKDNYLVLQRLGCLSELLDAHDTENHIDFCASHHDVHEIVSVCQCLRNDLSSQFTEATLKQITNLVNGLLQHDRLHLAPIISLRHDCIVRLHLIRLLKRIFRQLLDNHDDLFDWLDDNAFGVIRENKWSCSQYKACKDSCREL